MNQHIWKVVGISRVAQIVSEKVELGVILPTAIAMKLRVTVMEILKAGSGVKQGPFSLQQVAPLNEFTPFGYNSRCCQASINTAIDFFQNLVYLALVYAVMETTQGGTAVLMVIYRHAKHHNE